MGSSACLQSFNGWLKIWYMVLEQNVVDTMDLLRNRKALKSNNQVVAVVGFGLYRISSRDFS